ncbi:MAG: hypothetical protein RLZZ381_1310, partial [Cyanobacteriota bacterium]
MVLPLILSNGNAFAQSKSNLGNQQLTEVKTDSSSKRSRRKFKTPIFYGQKVKERAVVPVGNQEKITKIVVYFVDEAGKLVSGKTQPKIITQEFELQPGDIYRADLAKKGLEGVLDLTIVDRASLSLEKVVDNQAIMAIAVQENSNLSIGFDLTLPAPTALQGSV